MQSTPSKTWYIQAKIMLVSLPPGVNGNKLPTEAEAQGMLARFLDFPSSEQHSTELFPDFLTAAKSLREQRAKSIYSEGCGVARLSSISPILWFHDSNINPVYQNTGTKVESIENWVPREAKSSIRRGCTQTTLCQVPLRSSNAGHLVSRMNTSWKNILSHFNKAEKEFFIDLLRKRGLLDTFTEAQLIQEIKERTSEYRGPFYLIVGSSYMTFLHTTHGTESHFHGIPIVVAEYYYGRLRVDEYAAAVIAKDQFKANHKIQIWADLKRIPRYWQFASAALLKFQIKELKGDGSEETILDELEEDQVIDRFKGI